MKTTILITGKTTDKHCAALLEMYVKRVRNYTDLTVIEMAENKFNSSESPESLKEKTFLLQQKYLTKTDHIVLLDETGKLHNSIQFADFIMRKQSENRKHIMYIIGGSYGFSKSLYAMAAEKISLSPMTFPHQLVRVIFAEQLYRAYTIINNEKYHH